jgi:hypothetical protein
MPSPAAAAGLDHAQIVDERSGAVVFDRVIVHDRYAIRWEAEAAVQVDN